MKLTYLVIIVFILTCCDFNSKNMVNKTENINSYKTESVKSIIDEKSVDSDTIPIRMQSDRVSKIETMKKGILENGDKYDFVTLHITFINEGDYMSILPYALFMAEKYNNKDAYKIYFINFIKILNNGVYKDEYFFNLDIETQNFLKKYIKKGAALDHRKCKEILINLEKIAKERKLKF